VFIDEKRPMKTPILYIESLVLPEPFQICENNEFEIFEERQQTGRYEFFFTSLKKEKEKDRIAEKWGRNIKFNRIFLY